MRLKIRLAHAEMLKNGGGMYRKKREKKEKIDRGDELRYIQDRLPIFFIYLS